MQIEDVILNRRSIRKFCTSPISKEKIEKIIESARWAPSACDRQSWKFIVIDDEKIKKRIVEDGGAKFIQESPVGILVLYDNRTDNLEYQDHIQSAAAAIQNMLLTATTMEIGSCWICHLPLKSRLRELLKIPNHYDPVAYVALGYYKEKLKVRPRQYQLSEIVSWNKFNFKEDSSLPLGVKLTIRRFLRTAYFKLPLCCKRLLAPIAERFVNKFEKF